MGRPKKHRGSQVIQHRKPDGRQERCMACKQMMERVTPGHLREHGLSIARYERMYGARRPPSRAERGSVTDPTDPEAALIETVGERLSESKVWIACLADEVGERMLTGPLRQRLTAMLTTMLFQRARVHGESIAILNVALEELRQEWRATQGGHDGGPTDTDTLLRMIDRAAKLVGDSEDAVQRTMKLALEEQKAAHQYADAMGPTLYTGSGEKLDIPAGVTTGDRELMRNLMALVGRAANEARMIPAEVRTPSPHPPGTPSPPPVNDASFAQANTTNDASFVQGNGPNDASSRQGGGTPHPLPPGGSPLVEPSGSPSDPTGARARLRARRRGAEAAGATPRAPAGASDEEGPVNDPARGARGAGGPGQHRESVGEVQGVPPSLIVSGRESVGESGDGGEGVIVSGQPAPAPVSPFIMSEEGTRRRRPKEGPTKKNGGMAAARKQSETLSRRNAEQRRAWEADKRARGMKLKGKALRGKRKPKAGGEGGAPA